MTTTLYKDRLETRQETFIVKEKGYPMMHEIKPITEEARREIQGKLDQSLKRILSK